MSRVFSLSQRLMFLGLVLCLSLGRAAAGQAVGSTDFRAVVQQARERVFPAVVFIRCVQETLDAGEKVSLSVSGSGVIISPGGRVLTNWHVVNKAVEVRCLLSDGRHYDARVVGQDKTNDVALLQLQVEDDEERGDFPYAELGESAGLAEGDFVMAMGAPWGLNRSVSIGIISCTRRFLPGISEYSLWLQTDAAINPGNSGGPLVDTGGRVIGINTRGMSYAADNMGFAIPADTIRIILPRLEKSGKVDWSYTGLHLQPLRDFNRNTYFEADRGVIVADTDPSSPARAAGIRPLDRIVAINGREIAATTAEDLPALRRELGLLPQGEEAVLEIMRHKEKLRVSIVPGRKGAVEGDELECPRWDFTVKEINRFDNEDLFFYREKGVYVYGVKWPGNAAEAGLRENDLLLEIDGHPVQTLDEVRKLHEELLRQVDRKHRIIVTVLRNGLMRQIVLDYLRDYSRE